MATNKCVKKLQGGVKIIIAILLGIVGIGFTIIQCWFYIINKHDK